MSIPLKSMCMWLASDFAWRHIFWRRFWQRALLMGKPEPKVGMNQVAHWLQAAR